MPEPTLVSLAAQSAAKAVGGMAVRASAPAWKAAFAKLRPAPAEVRRAAAWPEVKLARAQQDAIAKYLGGRLCTGLLELLAFLELAEDGVEREEEKRRLGATFRRELVEKLDLADEQAEGIAAALWTQLHDCVRLQVGQLRELGAFAEEDLVHVARLAQRQQDDPATTGSVARSVAERSSVSANHQRVLRAHGAVRVIKEAMRERYSKLVMPHSKEDYRVPIEQIYVTRRLSPLDRESDPVPEKELADRRFVVVGNPGAGKSTFIRHLLYQLGSGEQPDHLAPMVVELKEYQAPQDSYVSVLAERLRVICQAELDVDTVRDVLLLGLATVVFDGLDEISDLDQRRSTVASIHAFCQRYPLVRVVVTSREEGYAAARLDPSTFPVYHLPDFTEEQVELYVDRWFGLVSVPRMLEPGERVRSFLADSVHVGDLRTNPLMLSLLCMLYEYDGYIPENRPQVYEDCAELLFERWDRVRRVPVSFRANTQTRYLVQELAYYFFNRVDSQGGETELKLRAVVQDYFERNVIGGDTAARVHAQDFLDYCAGRAWLLTQTGVSERGERLFGFTHRTFMEYFAACFVVRHCKNAYELVSRIKPLIVTASSEVVPQIAIQQFDIRVARGIDECLEMLVFDQQGEDSGGWRTCLEFTLRSLRFIRPTPRTLQRLYRQALLVFGRSVDLPVLTLMLDAPPETHELLGQVCQDVLTDSTATGAEDSTALRLGAGVVSSLLPKWTRDLPFGVRSSPLQLLRRDKTTGEIPLRESLGRLAVQAPDVIGELYRRNRIGVSEYVDLLGVRALVSRAEAMDGALGDEQPGPLVEQLGELFTTGYSREDLEQMLAVLAKGADDAVPFNARVTRELLDVADLFRGNVISLLFPLSGDDPPKAAAGFHRLFAAVLCAAVDLGLNGDAVLNGLPEMRALVGRHGLGKDASGRYYTHRAGLGPLLIDLVERTGPAPAWRETFEAWARGEVRIGIGGQ